MHYGKDCPKGMVQIEHVGVDPKLRESDYSYLPSESAFLEVYVDGIGYRIDVGDVQRADGTIRRGLHIVSSIGMVVDKHSLNAADIFVEPTPSEEREG